MELKSVKFPVHVPHGGDRGVLGIGPGFETRRQFLDAVPMGHPDLVFPQRDDRILDVGVHGHRAVLALRCGGDATPEGIGESLHAVADS